MIDPSTIADRLGAGIDRTIPLGEGTSGAQTVLTRIILDDGRDLVAKQARGDMGGLADEAAMLSYLADRSPLPVPRVHHAEDRLLLMDYIPGDAPVGGPCEDDLADHVAELHQVTAPAYGFDHDTNIALLRQPNGWHEEWLGFYGRYRLVHMARLAEEAGRVDAAFRGRVERLADRLPALIDPPAAPALLHGDLWSGNIRCDGTRIRGFIDPAISYGDPEMDLAMIMDFRAAGDRFLSCYDERRPLSADFRSAKRDIYGLWPILVHVRLFGGGYVAQAGRTLDRFA